MSYRCEPEAQVTRFLHMEKSSLYSGTAKYSTWLYLSAWNISNSQQKIFESSLSINWAQVGQNG